METYQCVVADLAYYGNEKSITITVNDEDDGFKISGEINEIEITSNGESYFESFQKFRDRLLGLGYGLKCKGSQINAVQSNMMGGSDKIYLVESGKPALMKDVVSIWEYADIDGFPDSKQQNEFHEKWFNG